MTALREAVVLPAIFLTVVLLAGLHVDARVVLAPPSLFSLVLAAILLGTLVRSGALAPWRLLHDSRPAIANANGFMALAALFAASAQLFSALTPRGGLPLLFVDVFLFVLLLNTWVAAPDRERLLRSLAVILGAALVLKFIVLAALSMPESRGGRALAALFDLATLGTVTQPPEPPIAGYAAFAATILYLIGVALLPRSAVADAPTTELMRR